MPDWYFTVSNMDRRHFNKVCKTMLWVWLTARTQIHVDIRSRFPPNSKFLFHVPVDAGRLRYCSKIFVMLIKYGNVLNIVILALRYLTAWCQNAVFRLFPPRKKIILRRLYDEFLIVNCQTEVRNNAIIILWPCRNRIKNYDLSEKTPPPENYLLEFTSISEMASGDPKSGIPD